MKISIVLVAMLYVVLVAPWNVRVCLYGLQSAINFEVAPPSIDEYLSCLQKISLYPSVSLFTMREREVRRHELYGKVHTPFFSCLFCLIVFIPNTFLFERNATGSYIRWEVGESISKARRRSSISFRSSSLAVDPPRSRALLSSPFSSALMAPKILRWASLSSYGVYFLTSHSLLPLNQYPLTMSEYLVDSCLGHKLQCHWLKRFCFPLFGILSEPTSPSPLHP